MIPIRVAGPAVEPVGLPELRAWLRLDDEAEDDLVAGLGRAARLLVEAAARRCLIAQTWRIALDGWPEGRVVNLPLSPLIGVAAIRLFDAAGGSAELAAGLYEAEPGCDPPRVRVSAAAAEPGRARGGIELDVTVGYGGTAAAVPEPLRLAIRLLVARWFENRGDAAGEQALPVEVEALLAPFRRARL